MILALLTVKKAAGRRISAKWQYRLDYIFLVILIMPFIPWNGLPASDTAIAVKTVHNMSNAAVDVAVGQAFGNYAMNRVAVPERAFIFIWAAGAAMTVVFMFIGIIRLYILSSKAEKVSDGVIECCMREMGISAKISIKRADVRSPMIFGLARPTMILPDIRLEESEMRHVLLHELVHYKRGDIAVNLLICLIEIIYWFDPIVWLVLGVTKDDMEAACDEAVMEITGDSLAYGMTILKFAGRRRISAVAADMGGAKRQIKRRVRAAAEFTRATTASSVRNMVIFIVAFITAISCLPMVSVTAGLRRDATDISGMSYEAETVDFGGFEGSFVIYDMNNDSYTVYNEENSLKRVSPDSTYKIISALSALEGGRISPDDSYIQWDGELWPFAEWNADQTLDTAMKNSVNWYFEELDREDTDGLREMMTKVGYGNLNFSGGAECWLESSLKISTVEQTKVLKGLYMNEYGFDQENIDAVKKAMRLSDGFYGKTGTGMVNGHEINGWFIGFAEAEDNVYFFALNIGGEDGANGGKAADMAVEILSDRGIIEYEG